MQVKLLMKYTEGNNSDQTTIMTSSYCNNKHVEFFWEFLLKTQVELCKEKLLKYLKAKVRIISSKLSDRTAVATLESPFSK